MPELKKVRYVYTIRENGDKKIWTRIGVAFTNKDDSINVVLNAFPLEGKLNIREAKDSEDKAE